MNQYRASFYYKTYRFVYVDKLINKLIHIILYTTTSYCFTVSLWLTKQLLTYKLLTYRVCISSAAMNPAYQDSITYLYLTLSFNTPWKNKFIILSLALIWIYWEVNSH